VQLRTALEELAALPMTRLVAYSRMYASAPMGPPDQPDYVNAVAGLLTQHAPNDLLGALQAIESRHGRDRSGPRWGPRTLDLDLLAYGQSELHTPALELPHPGLHERAFVLVPLAEVAPSLRIPGHGLVAALAARCDPAGLAVLD
jgi:2-amino-4-hydroxy-6-hydroxymethyldihydropteridine diphosphokinase